MALQKRVRKGLNFSGKELDRALSKIRERGGSKKEQLRLIKIALFSKDLVLRMGITEELIKSGHFRFLMDLAKKANKKHFPPDFLRETFEFGEFPTKKKLSEKTLKSLRQKLVNAVNKGPAFKYKGFDVYEIEGGFHEGGMLYHGSIYVDKSLSKKMKRIACAHEVGEIFHHQTGIGMELLEAKRQNAEKEYLEWIRRAGIGRIREVLKVAKKMPEMEEMAKELRKTGRKAWKTLILSEIFKKAGK